MRYCVKCGNPLNPTDKVCGYCGTRQPVAEDPRPTPTRPNNGAYAPKKKGMPGWGIALIVIAILAILGGAIYGVIYLVQERNKDPMEQAMEELYEGAEQWMEDSQQMLEDLEEEQAAQTPTGGMPYYVTGVASTIKVWESYGSGMVQGKLATGDEVQVLNADSYDYWEIAAGDITGYIDCHYLTDEWDAVCMPEVAYITEDDTVMLDEPFATGSDKVGYLDAGDEVTVLAMPEGSYWYIYSDDVDGYGYVPAASVGDQPDQEEEGERVIGAGDAPTGRTMLYYVDSNDGFLSLRAQATTSAQELGRITTGSEVWVVDTHNGATFWYVYAPTLGQYGYVHSAYLDTDRSDYEGNGEIWTVRVTSGYLALRTAKAYDYYNEIGKLYTGEKVEVISKEGTYWWVYAPTLGMEGYVNSEYLYR